ncbi:MAG TPA: hypothetical protein VIT90_02880 [Lysobacter sp.]
MKTKPADKMNYPPRWADYEDRLRKKFAYMGFAEGVSVGDVNRFGERYRAAKSFKHADFAILADSTVHGYTALFRLLLCYSAFEHFLECLGWAQKDSEAALPEGAQDRVMAKLRSIDGHERFFRTTLANAGSEKRFVEEYLAGRPVNPVALAGAIRQAFGQGKLMPDPGGEDACAACCFILIHFLSTFMDREFSARIANLDKPFEKT